MLSNKPVALIGTRREGGFNACALTWITPSRENPPALSMYLDPGHLSWELIKAGAAFSVNFPGRELLRETAFLGGVSGRKAPKLKICGLNAVRGKFLDVPIFPACIGHLECEVTGMDRESHRIDAVVVHGMADEEAFHDHWRVDGKGLPLQHLGGSWYQSGGELLQQEKNPLLAPKRRRLIADFVFLHEEFFRFQGSLTAGSCGGRGLPVVVVADIPG